MIGLIVLVLIFGIPLIVAEVQLAREHRIRVDRIEVLERDAEFEHRMHYIRHKWCSYSIKRFMAQVEERDKEIARLQDLLDKAQEG